MYLQLEYFSDVWDVLINFRWVLPAVNRVVHIKARLVATVSGTHNKLKTIDRKLVSQREH